jgi:hypothetical protein
MDGKPENGASEEREGKVAPLVSWTMKLVHPESDTPDFIRIEGNEGVRETIDALRASLKERGWREVGGKPVQASLPEFDPEPEVPDDVVVIHEATVERLLDGKLQLKLYDTSVDSGDYPVLRFTTKSFEDMEAIIPIALPGEEHLPTHIKKVTWFAKWENSKKLNPRNGKPYRNLVELKAA